MQITNIQRERGNNTAHPMDRKRVIKGTVNNSDNKLGNLAGVDQFLERHDLLKLTQEEIDNLSRRVSLKEVEPIINSLPKQKALGPDGFTGEFYQTFKAEIIQIFYNPFQRIEKEGIIFNSFHEAIITLKTKPKTL